MKLRMFVFQPAAFRSGPECGQTVGKPNAKKTPVRNKPTAENRQIASRSAANVSFLAPLLSDAIHVAR
jgi:hypothetical protein